MNVNRGDIYIADLENPGGCEQGGIRPVLIIQNNIGNKYSPVVIVSAITQKRKAWLPTHVELTDEKGVLDYSIVLLEQIRTIDKNKLRKKTGYLRKSTMACVDACLKYSLGLAKKYPIKMCLCPKCRSYYGYIEKTRVWRTNPDQAVKEPCTFCGVKTGYDYYLLDESEFHNKEKH